MEVLDQFIVPEMFVGAAPGEMSSEEAVGAAEKKIASIFGKWREAGKIGPG